MKSIAQVVVVFFWLASLTGCAPFSARWYLASDGTKDAGAVVVTILNTTQDRCLIRSVTLNGGGLTEGATWRPAAPPLVLAPGQLFIVPASAFEAAQPQPSPAPFRPVPMCTMPLSLTVSSEGCGLALPRDSFTVRFERRLPAALPDTWLSECVGNTPSPTPQ